MAEGSGWGKIARRIRVPLGFLFAVVYAWLAHPSPASILLGSVVVAAGLLLRGLASGHVRKNEELTTRGPYAYSRNPLYLGSLIMGVGFAVAARSWWIAVLILLFFLTVYWPVIVSEEAFLRERFAEFEDYSHRVPRLIPTFRSAGSAGTRASFSKQLYFQHREYNAALGAAAMMAILAGKILFHF